MDFQSEKQVVRDYYEALERADVASLADVQTEFYAAESLWRGFHPFDEITSPEEVAKRFWAPLKTSLSSLQRRMDVFMAGQNTLGGGVWVCSMGHLMGLFDGAWLGIRPTGKLAMLRYCEFHRVEGGKIAETAMYFDIPHLMVQAGQNPFGPQTAQHMVQPGPRTHDGLMFEPQPEAEGIATMAAIDRMVNDLGTWGLGLPLEEELRRSWHEDMLWWGPEGIGATYTIPRYAKQHSGPFRAAFAERSKTQHICRMAEGSYGGFFGWPNFTAVHKGGFMGLPAGKEKGAFRVIDIYRREGGKLAENWIYIDILHFLKTQGVDVLGRLQSIGTGSLE
ncbi:ester cyclase [uncultured Lentibacter sp.]|uniref:nuclear transport factor 2 family protein n=1 Tax=uncultured Lentibacter sp. TaxID=1659309 RepID=UPI00262EB024|nr:ester cyclase [uncultured Lentibacter sp.]